MGTAQQVTRFTGTRQKQFRSDVPCAIVLLIYPNSPLRVINSKGLGLVEEHQACGFLAFPTKLFHEFISVMKAVSQQVLTLYHPDYLRQSQ
jgi:hypothetical protein